MVATTNKNSNASLVYSFLYKLVEVGLSLSFSLSPSFSLFLTLVLCSGIHRVLQGAGGGEHPGQFCGCLRAAWRTDGLWVPSNYWQQDPTGVSIHQTHRWDTCRRSLTISATICRYITQEGAKLEVAKSKVPTTVTNAVSWRSEGIKYKKNEVFIDVIESINVLVGNDIFCFVLESTATCCISTAIFTLIMSWFCVVEH